MAIIFDAASDRLLRTANLPSYDSNYTVLMWVQFASYSGAGIYSTLWTLNRNSGSDAADAVYIKGASASASQFGIYAQGNGGAGFSEAFQLTDRTTNTWYCVALVRSANNLRTLYVGTLSAALASATTLTATYSARSAPTRMEIGGFASGNIDPLSASGGRVGVTKIWTEALTLGQLIAAQYVYHPVWLSNLHIYSPMFQGSQRVDDWSNNGYDWTEAGTLTDDSNPPISIGGRSVRVIGQGSGATNTGTVLVVGQATSFGITPTVGSISTGIALVSARGIPLAPAPALGAISTSVTLVSSRAQAFSPTPAPGTLSVPVSLVDSRGQALAPAPTAFGDISTSITLVGARGVGLSPAPALGAIGTAITLVAANGQVFAVTPEAGGTATGIVLAQANASVLGLSSAVGDIETGVQLISARASILAVTPALGDITTSVTLAVANGAVLPVTPVPGLTAAGIELAIANGIMLPPAPALGDIGTGITLAGGRGAIWPVSADAGLTIAGIELAVANGLALPNGSTFGSISVSVTLAFANGRVYAIRTMVLAGIGVIRFATELHVIGLDADSHILSVDTVTGHIIRLEALPV